MALPSLAKTWQFNVNQTAGSSSTLLADSRDLMLKIKNSLIGFANSPWTVWGSCDGAGNFGNGDNVDWWSATSDLVWAAAGSNHSWIVLTQSGIHSKASLLIDLSNASAFNVTIQYSPATGFGSANGGTDGTATNRPTPATGTYRNTAVDANWGPTTVGFTGKLHVMMSSDGECTRMIFCRSSTCPSIWIIDKAKSPISAWANPSYACTIGTTGNADEMTYANFNDTANILTKIGADNVNCYLTSDGWGAATAGENITVADDDTGEWLMEPMGLASTTVGHRGVTKGSVYDLWWSSTALGTGYTFPSDVSNAFAMFGDWIVPWDGSTPLVS